MVAKVKPVYLVAGGLLAAALMYRTIKSVGGAVGGAAETVKEATVGALTGRNAITDAARTDAYQGAGILGTLGAATDIVLGGVPSRVGETLGGWMYDVTHWD